MSFNNFIFFSYNLFCIINRISYQTNQNLPLGHMSYKKNKNEENKKYIYMYQKKKNLYKKLMILILLVKFYIFSVF